jgi:hypothetical protein
MMGQREEALRRCPMSAALSAQCRRVPGDDGWYRNCRANIDQTAMIIMRVSSRRSPGQHVAATPQRIQPSQVWCIMCAGGVARQLLGDCLTGPSASLVQP